jgi:hypothetical protein
MLFKQSIWFSQQTIVGHLAGVPLADQTSLRHDYDHARAKIELELTLKLAHWQQLPYVVCGLSHWNNVVAMNTAKTALSLFDSAPTAPQARHTQSRRFLDPSWKGLSDDEPEPPLRPVVAWLW